MITTKKYISPYALLLTIAFIAGFTGVSAQDSTKLISVKEAIAAAVNNNSSVQIAKLDENIAAANYKQTEAIYLPQIGLSYTAMATNNPLNSFGFKLQQKSVTQNDFNPSLLNNPDGSTDFATKLEVQQPIINMDMLYMRKAALKQTALYQYKTQRTKEFITYEVQKAFLQLQLAYEAVKVLEEALQTAKSVYTFTNNHFQQGLIQKSDVLNAQLQVTTVESNLAKAKSNIGNASDYISLLMGKLDGIIYTINETDKETENYAVATKIPSSRADFMAMQTAVEATDLMIKSDKMSYLPKVNAFGSYQLNDAKIAGFGAGAYLLGIQVSWNIFKGNKTKNSIATKNIERNKIKASIQSEIDQNQLDLNKSNRALADGLFEINQQHSAVTQASEALRILQNRYQQGLVNTTDVLMAQTQLVQQKFALAQAVYNTNVTSAYIQLLTVTSKK